MIRHSAYCLLFNLIRLLKIIQPFGDIVRRDIIKKQQPEQMNNRDNGEY